MTDLTPEQTAQAIQRARGAVRDVVPGQIRQHRAEVIDTVRRSGRTTAQVRVAFTTVLEVPVTPETEPAPLTRRQLRDLRLAQLLDDAGVKP